MSHFGLLLLSRRYSTNSKSRTRITPPEVPKPIPAEAGTCIEMCVTGWILFRLYYIYFLVLEIVFVSYNFAKCTGDYYFKTKKIFIWLFFDCIRKWIKFCKMSDIKISAVDRWINTIYVHQIIHFYFCTSITLEIKTPIILWLSTWHHFKLDIFGNKSRLFPITISKEILQRTTLNRTRP